MPVLETARLTLRPVELADAEAFAPFLADPEVVRFIGGVTMSLSEVEERVKVWVDRFARDGFGHFAIVRREDGCVVGRCGLMVWELPGWEITTLAEATGEVEIEMGWMLGREHWGNGYATEAALAVRDFAFDELGLVRLISLIADDNLASVAVARRLGMTPEGQVKQHDMPVTIWALAR